MLAARIASTAGVYGMDGKCARSESRSLACSIAALMRSLTVQDRRDAVVSWPCRVEVRNFCSWTGDFVVQSSVREILTDTKSRNSSSNIPSILDRSISVGASFQNGAMLNPRRTHLEL